MNNNPDHRTAQRKQLTYSLLEASITLQVPFDESGQDTKSCSLNGASIQEVVEIILVASCYIYQDKLRPYGPLDWHADSRQFGHVINESL